MKGDLDNMAQAESKISERLRACYENDSQTQAPMAPNPALNMFAPPFNLAHPAGGPGGLPASFPPNYAAAPGNMQRFPQFQMAQPMQQPNWYSQHPGPWSGSNSFQPQNPVSSNPMQQNPPMIMGANGPQASGPAGQVSGQTGANNGNAASTQNGSTSPWPPAEVVNLYIPNLAVGAIIGQKGSYIRKIIQLSKASIKVAPLQKQAEENPPAQTTDDTNGTTNRERIVTISGTPEAQWNAQFYIFDKIKSEGFCGNDEPRLMTEITVPKSKVGKIIGKGGRKVREIQQLSAAIVKLPEQVSDQGDDVKIQIIGNFYANQTAQRFVRALCSANQPNANIPLTGPLSQGAAVPATSTSGSYGSQRNQPSMQQPLGPMHQQLPMNGNPAMPMPPTFGSMVPPPLGHPYPSSSQAYGGPLRACNYGQQQFGNSHQVQNYHHGNKQGQRPRYEKKSGQTNAPTTILATSKDKEAQTATNGATTNGSTVVNGTSEVVDNENCTNGTSETGSNNGENGNASPVACEDVQAPAVELQAPPAPVPVESAN